MCVMDSPAPPRPPYGRVHVDTGQTTGQDENIMPPLQEEYTANSIC